MKLIHLLVTPGEEYIVDAVRYRVVKVNTTKETALVSSGGPNPSTLAYSTMSFAALRNGKRVYG